MNVTGYSALSLSALTLFVASMTNGACGGTVIGFDETDDDGDCFAPAGCGADTPVQSCPPDADCYERTECGETVLCQVTDQCAPGAALCDPSDSVVDVCSPGASCYEVESCGQTYVCEVGTQCGAIPTCDDEDTPVNTCPPDANCYDVTLCGSTQTCIDVPAGCPATPPADGQSCNNVGEYLECEYPDGFDCVVFYACDIAPNDGWTWNFIGGGCGGGPGTSVATTGTGGAPNGVGGGPSSSVATSGSGGAPNGVGGGSQVAAGTGGASGF